MKARGRRGAARPAASGPVDAREITVTGPPSLIDLSPGPQAGIQVAEANPGLCAVLENAALLYANGQAVQARQILEQGVASDNDTKVSPLAWLALFDLLQRAGDHAAFDQLAAAIRRRIRALGPGLGGARGAQRGPAQGRRRAAISRSPASSSPANAPQIGASCSRHRRSRRRCASTWAR